MDRDLSAPLSRLHPVSLGAFLLTTSLTLGLPGGALALGVGRPVTQSALGQPLNLLFPIRLNADETLGTDCVHAEVMAGDARVPASLVQLQLEGENEASVRAVRLKSSIQIDEPIVSINLSVGCPARFTRQFTAFIDPPSLQALAAAPAVEPSSGDMPSRNYSPALRAALATAEAKPAALLATPPASGEGLSALAADAPAPAASAPVRKARPARASTAAAISPADSASAAPKTNRQAKAKQPKPATELQAGAKSASPASAAAPAPRLRLDPAESAELAALAAAASQPASAPDASAELAAALARLQKLEENLNRVQQENRGTQDKLQAMRTQLEQAQRERYSSPLLLGLGALVLVLIGAMVYLWRSRKSEREVRESVWWNEVQREQRDSRLSQQPQDDPVMAAAPSDVLPKSAQDNYRVAPPTLPMPLAAIPVAVPDERTMVLPNLSFAEEQGQEPLSIQFVDPSSPVTMPAPMPFDDGSRPVRNDPVDRPVTVEELIDLEQQVDFFQVLGQDEAAIELLQARIGTGAASALPYLKLLEIFQRRGEEQAFAALTERFADRFHALPPTWGADLNEGRQLEAYGSVLKRVQDNWGDSAASMALLQHLLSRGGEEAQGFDLPAYRDLLQLYSVARDLSEREQSGEQIDLFLPLDGDSDGMMATMVWQSSPAATAGHGAIDVDLSLDMPLDEPFTPSSASIRR